MEELHDRDVASAAEALLACELGASVVRTHNVEMTVAALKDLRPAVLLGLGSQRGAGGRARRGDRGAKSPSSTLPWASCAACPTPRSWTCPSFYESEPAYYEDQDAFVNAVVLLRSGLPPKELLGYLHGIENCLGRVRAIENGPRTLRYRYSRLPDVRCVRRRAHASAPARDGARFRREACCWRFCPAGSWRTELPWGACPRPSASGRRGGSSHEADGA